MRAAVSPGQRIVAARASSPAQPVAAAIPVGTAALPAQPFTVAQSFVLPSDGGRGFAKLSDMGTIRRHSSPVKIGPSALKVDLRSNISGSRLWALADVLGFDEEDANDVEESGLLPMGQFLDDALASRFSIDDRCSYGGGAVADRRRSFTRP